MKKLILCLIVLLGAQAYADVDSDTLALETTAADVAKNCDVRAGTCKAPFTARVFKGREIARLPVAAKLKKLAVTQADQWPDTIYEGDYVPASRTLNLSLDSVVRVLKNKKFAVYYMTFSEAALATGDEGCKYNEAKKQYEGACPPGRVVERSYVNEAATITVQISEDDYSTFEPSKP